MWPIDVARQYFCMPGDVAHACPFTISLMPDGNRIRETIPPKKSQVYLDLLKKFCDATPLINSTRQPEGELTQRKTGLRHIVMFVTFRIST
jgi:hypothetical protein